MENAQVINLRHNTTALANSALNEVRSIKTALQGFYRELQRYEKQLAWVIDKLRDNSLCEDAPDGRVDKSVTLRLRSAESADPQNASVKTDEGDRDE